MTTYKCGICQKQVTDYGNNGHPLTSERVCDNCNTGHIVPIRLALSSLPNPLERFFTLEAEKDLCEKLYGRRVAA